MLLRYNFSNISNIEMQLSPSSHFIHSLLILSALLYSTLTINIKNHVLDQQQPPKLLLLHANRRKTSSSQDQILVPSVPARLAHHSLPQKQKDIQILKLKSVSSNQKSNKFYKYYSKQRVIPNQPSVRLLTSQLSASSSFYLNQQRNAPTKQSYIRSKDDQVYNIGRLYLSQENKQQRIDNPDLLNPIFKKQMNTSIDISKSGPIQSPSKQEFKIDDSQGRGDSTVVKYEVTDSVSNIFIASNGNSFSNSGSPQQIRSMYNSVLKSIQNKITNEMFRDSSTKISLSTLSNNPTNKKQVSQNESKMEPVIAKTISFEIKTLNEEQKIVQRPKVKQVLQDIQIIEPNNLFNVDNSQLKNQSFISMSFIEYKIRYSSPALISTETRQYREKIYYKNIQFINKFNKNSFREYNMGLNAYTDLQQKEFINIFAKLKIPDSLISDSEKVKSTKPLPKIRIDWKCYTLATVVQGSCKNYVQPALQAIYITKRIYKQPIATLSSQQILSCGRDDQRNSCEDGFYSGAFQYVLKKGVGPNIIYPEERKIKGKGQISQCNYSLINDKEYNVFKIFIKQSKRVTNGDCEQLTKVLKNRAVVGSIKTQYFQFYKEGVFVSRNKEINHGVLIVGYDPKKGFLIKNSWGVNWGIEGFAYVHQSTGICSYAIYPVLLNEGGESNQCPSKQYDNK